MRVFVGLKWFWCVVRLITYMLALLFVVCVWALLTRHMPKDKDGYRWEYFDGRLMQIKDFIPPCKGEKVGCK